jgi:hypothetical protein
LTIHHQHLNDFHKTSSMIVRTVTPLFCVVLLRQNWTFCGRRLYSCLVAREKITITFVERLICLLLVSNLNLLTKSKSLLFTNFTSKGGLTPRQQLAICCLQHFLVMTGNITKKCCRQHVANCCLGVRPPLYTTYCSSNLRWPLRMRRRGSAMQDVEPRCDKVKR